MGHWKKVRSNAQWVIIQCAMERRLSRVRVILMTIPNRRVGTPEVAPHGLSTVFISSMKLIIIIKSQSIYSASTYKHQWSLLLWLPKSWVRPKCAVTTFMHDISKIETAQMYLCGEFSVIRDIVRCAGGLWPYWTWSLWKTRYFALSRVRESFQFVVLASFLGEMPSGQCQCQCQMPSPFFAYFLHPSNDARLSGSLSWRCRPCSVWRARRHWYWWRRRCPWEFVGGPWPVLQQGSTLHRSSWWMGGGDEGDAFECTHKWAAAKSTADSRCHHTENHHCAEQKIGHWEQVN